MTNQPTTTSQTKNTKKYNRCSYQSCNKKLSLTSLKCRCGHKFCRRHFYCENHDCTYDYKTNAKKNLINSGSITNNCKFTKITKI